MALRCTQWVFLSFVLAFCLVQSTHSAVPREKVALDSDQNQWGPCGRYACGKKKREPKSEKESAEYILNKAATVGGTPDKKASILHERSFKSPCWRFGCRKRKFLFAISTGKKIVDDQLHSGEQRPKTAAQSKHTFVEPKPRCFRFGCKKSFDQSVIKNQKTKTFSDGMKAPIQCDRFGCYVKKNDAPQAKQLRQEMKAKSRKRFSNVMFIHKRYFQERHDEN